VTVRDNVFYGLRNASAALIVGQGKRLQNIRIVNNAFQFQGLKSALVRADPDMHGVSFSGNTYWSDADPGAWFYLGRRQALGFDAFLAEVHKQSKANWREEFTAAAVNDYLRAGFGMQPIQAGGRPRCGFWSGPCRTGGARRLAAVTSAAPGRCTGSV